LTHSYGARLLQHRDLVTHVDAFKEINKFKIDGPNNIGMPITC